MTATEWKCANMHERHYFTKGQKTAESQNKEKIKRAPSSDSGAICAPTQRDLTFLGLTFHNFLGAEPSELQGQFEGRLAFVPHFYFHKQSFLVTDRVVQWLVLSSRNNRVVRLNPENGTFMLLAGSPAFSNNPKPCM